ncbi:MFS transporter [Streptomyces sp. B6B3]|uniref:MFS transporter n=1 Tax=Streptomyces sp. B6B3 TaxID=3153570 RepID=UPI00325EF970
MNTSGVRSLAAYGIDRRPLAIAAYRRLWVASAVCAVGGSFSVVAIPAQLFAVTGSSAAVGQSAAVSLVTLVVAALWTGAVADTRDRRTVLLTGHVGLVLTYAALWAQTAVLGGGSVAVLMVLVACQGLAFGAIMTTMGAVLPRLVPAQFLPAANSLSALVRYGAYMTGAAAAWGVTVVVLGLAAQLWLALAALVVGGAVNFVLSTFRNAITQALTDDALRGRVQGSLTIVTIGGPQVGNLVHGVAASVLEPRLVICAGGVLTTVTVAVIAWRVPELRHFTRQDSEGGGG